MPTVVAIAIVRQENQFLVGVRPPGTHLAGFAEFPGGKVNEGETPAAAAARECREESGLDVEPLTELFSTTHQYDHGCLEIHFLECRPLNFQQLPSSPFRWVNKQELATLRFPAANAPLTKILLAGEQ